MAQVGRRRLAVWIGTVVLILLVAFVPLWLSGRDDPEPASTQAAVEPTANPSEAAVDPTAEPTEARPTPREIPLPPTSAPSPLPTPDPRTVETLAGSSSVKDAPGDVMDSASEVPPDVNEAADLLGVDLSSDGETLEIVWRLAGDVPEGGDLLWSVDLWSKGELAATVTVQLVGPRVVAGALDWATGEQIALPEAPRLEPAAVALTVPLGALPALEPPLMWEALGQQDGGWEDRAPEGGPTSFGG